MQEEEMYKRRKMENWRKMELSSSQSRSEAVKQMLAEELTKERSFWPRAPALGKS